MLKRVKLAEFNFQIDCIKEAPQLYIVFQMLLL